MDRVDISSLTRAAQELQDRYRGSFEQRGGRISVKATRASNLRARTKSIELLASVEWEAPRIYDHAHAEVARRPWFSKRWKTTRPLPAAVRHIETTLSEWLRSRS